ncbi:hypothetical protein [Cellulomonas sp. ATA003]|nr:hypothetical protein [Cellulomonas sp. ATA003]WNB87245.1 hypothetical protein REH70_09160 [Cellulomonas sp. ATA003]
MTEPSADPLEVSISRLVAEQVGARGDGDGLSGEQNASSAR